MEGPPVHQNRGIDPRCVPGRSPSIPGSRGPGDQKRGGRGDLRPSPPLEVGEEGEGSGKGRSKRPGTAMGPPIAVPVGEGGGRGGVITPPPNPAALARSPMLRRLATRGGSPQLGESISPREVPLNRHPIGLGADGEPWDPASPDFRIGGEANGAHGDGRGTEQIGGGNSPPPSGAIGGSKEPPIDGNWGRRGEDGFENSGPGPEFLSSSSAETPMSCEQGRRTAGNDSGSDSPRVVLP